MLCNQPEVYSLGVGGRIDEIGADLGVLEIRQSPGYLLSRLSVIRMSQQFLFSVLGRKGKSGRT